MTEAKIGIIGGSGVYEMEALTDVEEIQIETPFGAPSDAYMVGTLEGMRVAFLPRHGRGHRLLPTELNARANIWGFKKMGVEWIISVSACGSLREDYAPGHIVIPDQLFDHTRLRPQHTFFGRGLVAHIGLADPFCPDLSTLLYQAVQQTGATVHRGGTLIIIEGPRFSTKGESRIYRQWGCDIIGMTAVPEIQLAREAEICYATMAHVTDYDVWHESEEPVTVEAIVRILRANAETAKQAIQNVAAMLPTDRTACECATALESAIFTQHDLVPPAVRQDLDLLIGKYLD